MTIAYVTTGERPEYRETRCKAMCQWTLEVCRELHLERWATLFRFAPITLETLYGSDLFDGEVWLEPGRKEPVGLFR